MISGDFTGTVLEAGGVANGTPGIPTATGDLNAADVDNPPAWTPVVTLTPGDNGFGSYTLTAAGVWTYTLDDSNATVQALNAGRDADRHLHGQDGRTAPHSWSPSPSTAPTTLPSSPAP